MDASSYKDITTSRGIKYRYFYSPPTNAKPTLLFIHGFPCTSQDWRKQVPFFKERGYGLLVPDLLGYGGTDKPSDTASYKLSKMSADLLELLDAEKVEQVIAVGHDWYNITLYPPMCSHPNPYCRGSTLNSRVANYYQDRFLGFGFVAVGYTTPQPDLNLDVFIAFIKQMVGYETSGYWKCVVLRSYRNFRLFTCPVGSSRRTMPRSS